MPYILHTDACQDGLGAVLYQKQNSQLCVIAYASGTLTTAKQNYYMHSGKLKFLALKWAISDYFRDYLYYFPPFVVYTDNNPLTYVLTSAKLNATGHRWVGELTDFKFSIRYHPGKAHADADGLSRMPLHMKAYMASCTKEVSAEVISSVINASTHQVCQKTAWVTLITSPDNALKDNNHIPDKLTPVKVEQIDLLDAELEDRDIEPIISYMRKSVKPTRDDLSHASCIMKLLSYELNKLFLEKDGTLRRRSGPHTQIVLPKLHGDMGHLGVERVVSLAIESFYWPHMQQDIANFISQQCQCLKQKPSPYTS